MIETGNWLPIKDWLATHIFKQGRLYSPNDLIKRATGDDISAHYLIDYLYRKYELIYEKKLTL